jgi:WD40 repeat protein/serine/threonine protein kinase
MNSEASANEPGSPLSAEQESQLNSLIEQYMRDLQSGSAPDVAHLVAAHPDLAPFLEQRCEFVQRIFLLSRQPTEPDPISSSSSPASNPPSDESDSTIPPFHPVERSQRLNCPHCGADIQLVSPVTEITCRNCGSTFQLDADATEAYPAEAVPRRIGRFHILSMLGRGGFGVVYKAQDPQLGRLVAVKVPRANYFITTEEEQRFLREARSAARLRHASIVQVHEVAYDGRVPYIVTEFVDGLTLGDLLTGRRTTFREAAEIIAQVADALEYAHQQQVVHRDIKPNNILLDSSGKPFVADFGLARTDETEFTITLQGQVLGTPSYMSPEQADGRTDLVDRRSDVYSLGVVLYRMLCGELPFRGSKRMLLHQVIHVDPAAPRSINEHIPKDLDTITLKAMAKEPNRRYQTAREFADDLRRWLNGEPIRARPIGKLERLLRWSRRNPTTASLSAVVALLLLIAATGSTVWAYRESLLHDVTRIAHEREQVAHRQAAASADESRSRLAHTMTLNGINQLEGNNYFSSLLWLCESIPLLKDAAAQRVQRIRIASVLQHLPRLERLAVLDSPVEQAVVSGDRSRLLARTRSGNLKVWDVNTGQFLYSVVSTGQLVDIAFSHDGQLAATASRDGTGQIWRFEGAQPRVLTVRHESWLTRTAISPDSKWVATASDDKTARIWDAETGVQKHRLAHDVRVTQVVFSPNSGQLLTVSGQLDSAHEVRFWNVDSGELLPAKIRYERQTAGVPRIIWATEFSPDGQLIACASEDGTAQLWKVESGEAVFPPFVHTAPVNDIAFSPDGAWLATADRAGMARVWNTQTGAPATSPLPHRGAAASPTFSPDGEILTIGSGGAVWSWRRHDGRLAQPPLEVDRSIASAGFVDRRKIVTYSGAKTLRVWDLETDIDKAPVFQHEGNLTDCRFQSSGERVVTASRDGTARIWSIKDGSLVATLRHEADVSNAVFSPDGTLLATADGKNLLRFWDARSGVEVGPAISHPGVIVRPAFTPSGDRLVTGCADGRVRVWDIATRQLLFLAETGQAVLHIAISANGERIAACSANRTARVWSARDGQPVTPPLGHNSDVTRCDISTDGSRLATVSSDGTLNIWDVAQGRLLNSIAAYNRNAWWVAFSPDNKLVLSTGLEGYGLLTNWRSGEPSVPRLVSSKPFVHRGRFSPDGLFAVTSCGAGSSNMGAELGEGSARVWDVVTGMPLTPELRHSSAVVEVYFDSKSSALATASHDHTGRLWRLDPIQGSADELIRLAQVYSGKRIDEVTGIVILDAPKLEATFAQYSRE